MANILILFSTVDGHALKICRRLQDRLGADGHQVALSPVDAASETDLLDRDKIVIGASIRYGRHRPAVYEFIRTHTALLERVPSAFFSVNVVARKPARNRPDTNPYMRKFLKQIHWRPRELAVFAGKIDYPKYRFWDRQMIRFIMWLTKGPTAPDAVVEFTDWGGVDEFGSKISSM